MKYYLIAGERSGDLHGSNLVKELKRRDPESEFRGFGGDEMQKTGVTLAVHYAELAIMGVSDVLLGIFKILRLVRKCKQDILDYDPDVLILIDFGAFNLRIAGFAEKKGIKVFYYISPKVWAWNQSRALKIKRTVDRMFVILPFEKDFYKKFDYEVDFVGNPVADAVRSHSINKSFIEINNLDPEKKIIALLPGSRKQELRKMLPVMKQVAERNPQFQFVVAGVNSLPAGLYEIVSEVRNVSVAFEQTYDLLAHADAAIVTSGTATLETALWHVPQVVIYKSDTLNYFAGKLLIKVKYISLVNLIADKEVVKELLHNNVQADVVSKEFLKIANESDQRRFQLKEYEKLSQDLGQQNPSAMAAELMFKYLKSD
jgi:lipid-A-disaccharide synthase